MGVVWWVGKASWHTVPAGMFKWKTHTWICAGIRHQVTWTHRSSTCHFASTHRCCQVLVRLTTCRSRSHVTDPGQQPPVSTCGFTTQPLQVLTQNRTPFVFEVMGGDESHQQSYCITAVCCCKSPPPCTVLLIHYGDIWRWTTLWSLTLIPENCRGLLTRNGTGQLTTSPKDGCSMSTLVREQVPHLGNC